MTHTDPHRESRAEGAFRLHWTKCQCGYPSCRYQYPTNLGSYYQGTGFDTEERDLLDRAFAALAASPRPDPVPGPTRGEVTDEMVERAAIAILDRRGFGFYIDPMEGGQDAYDISCEALNEARAALSAARPDTPSSRDPVQGVEVERRDYLSDRQARELFDLEDDDALEGRVRVCEGEWIKIPGGYYFDSSPGHLHPEVGAALAASDRAPADDGWRPIETAPKDGTPIDLWAVHEDRAERRPNCTWGDCQDWTGREYESWQRLKTPYRDWAATHWRPLPTPPVEQQPIRSTKTEDGR